MGDQLLPLPLTERSVHQCVDMQQIFSAEGFGRRHGWTGSCRSRRRSRTVIPNEPSSRCSSSAALSATLIVDEDGIYDPRHPNDRLLLGMKGTMSEMELSLFR